MSSSFAASSLSGTSHVTLRSARAHAVSRNMIHGTIHARENLKSCSFESSFSFTCSGTCSILFSLPILLSTAFWPKDLDTIVSLLPSSARPCASMFSLPFMTLIANDGVPVLSSISFLSRPTGSLGFQFRVFLILDLPTGPFRRSIVRFLLGKCLQ